MSCLLTREQVRTMSVQELDAALDRAFSFDQWAWQRENKIKITEPDRAEGLERVLYQCPVCGAEGHMKGAGTGLNCGACGARWELDEYGVLQGDRNPYPHVPDWYAWQRQQVKKELEEGTYRLDLPVKIGMMIDYKAIYMVGEGRLVHTNEGFTLTGCDGKLNYTQGPLSCYSLYSDYFWYEIGDMISIGTPKIQYYCFPKNENAIVAKARLAAEELFKLSRHGNK
jgi:transcription elongation factor Elf1